MNRSLLPILLLVLLAACSQQQLPCGQPTVFSVNVACYRKIMLNDTSAAGVPFIDTVTYGYPMPHAILGYIDKNGNAIPKYALIANDSVFSITLSPDSNVCRWFVNIDSLANKYTDTFTFYYQRNLKFISNACGYSYNYVLNRITYAQDTIPIDSVVIANPDISGNVNITNVNIYYRQ